MAQPSTERFQEAEKYCAYLRTTEGKLRADLGWTNLRCFLPIEGYRKRALDVGGGTGIVALRLAELGYQVTLLDNSEPMLAVARREADSRVLKGRISFSQGDAEHLSGLFESHSFDAVVCHNMLEYMPEPFAVLRGLAQMLRKDDHALLSLLVRNRWGEVLKSAVKDNSLELATVALQSETVLDSLYGQPVRVFDPVDLRSMVEKAGLEVAAERGVRVLVDCLCCDGSTEADYRRMLEFELLLGGQPQFAAVARYIQIIARPSSAPVVER